MIRILLQAAVFLASAAVGLLVAAWLIPQVDLSPGGFITAVVVFALAQSILTPFILKVAARAAPAFLGGIGIVSTFVAMVIASLFPGGLQIDGWRTWILAPVIVWLVTAIATLLLPFVIIRNKADRVRTSPRPR